MKKFLFSYWKYKKDEWVDCEKIIEGKTMDEAFADFRERNPTVKIFKIEQLKD